MALRMGILWGVINVGLLSNEMMPCGAKAMRVLYSSTVVDNSTVVTRAGKALL